MARKSKIFRSQAKWMDQGSLCKFHEVAEQYPPMNDEELKDLTDDMRENGYDPDKPILFLDGKIVDGRHRYVAAIAASVPFTIRHLPPETNAEEFAFRENVRRRHNTADAAARRRQRQKEVVELRQGGASLREIANKVGVGETQVRRDLASQVRPEGAPDSIISEENGKITERIAPPEPAEAPKVTGRDGKTYPASKPKTQPAEREPGDDTEQIDAEEAAENAAGRRRGQPLYDWRAFESPFGQLYRQIDVLGNAFRVKESDEANELRQGLKEFNTAFRQWYKQLTSQRAPE
jgi:ParB-like chromosome segregation protein Spo0J